MSRVRFLLEAYQGIPLWLRLALALLWAGLLWWLSSHRGSDLPDIGMGSFVSNGAHVGLFGVLAGLVFLAWGGPLPRRLPWSAALTVAYGVVDELHQSRVPGRSSSVADVLSDGCGALLAGCALLWILGKNVRARRALPLIAVLALCSVGLATWTEL